MVKRYSIFLLCLALFANQHLSAQGGGIDSSFGVNGVKKFTFGISYKGGTTNPYKLFGDSLNRITIVGQTTQSGINNFFATRWFADGSLDSSFGNSGTFFIPITSANANSFAIQQLQDDGKLLLAGTINTVQAKDVVISRYLSNGTLDIGFGTNGQTIIPISLSYGDDIPSDLVIVPGGKIIIAATTLGNSGYDFATIRLLPNGLIDSSFNLTGIAKLNISSGNDNAKKVVMQTDGKVIVGGETGLINKDLVFVRYLPNGNLDTTYGTQGKITFSVGSGDDLLMDLKLMPDGKLMALAQAIISVTSGVAVQLNADGSMNSSFGFSGVKPLGYLAKQILLDSVGTFYTYYTNFVRRHQANGNLDSGFGASGVYNFNTQTGGNSVFLVQMKDKSFRCAGQKTQVTITDIVVSGLTQNGLVLNTFGTSGMRTENYDYKTGIGKFTALAQTSLSDKSLVVAGTLILNSLKFFIVTKFKPNGDRDSLFAYFGSYIISVNATYISIYVKVRPDNNIQVATRSSMYPSATVNTSLFILDPGGKIVKSFGDNGFVNDTLGGGPLINFQSDGKIIIGISKRYFPDGRADTSFHKPAFNSSIYAITVLKNDYFLLAFDTMLIRLYPNGQVDSTFGTNGYFAYRTGTECSYPYNNRYFKILVITQEKLTNNIMLGGYYRYGCLPPTERIMKVLNLNENGTLNGTFPFASFGDFDAEPNIIQLPDRGFLLSANSSQSNNGPMYLSIVKRIFSSGYDDNLFGNQGSLLGGRYSYFGVSLYDNHQANWLCCIENYDTIYLRRIKFNAPPYLDFSANKTNPGFGDTTILTTLSPVTSKAYKWSVSPANYTYLQGTDSSSANPKIKFTKAGTYSITLKLFYDDTFCTITKANFISLTPLINFTANKTLLSFNDTVRLQASFNGWPTGLKWTFSTTNLSYLLGTDSTSQNPVVKLYSPGKFDVQLKVIYSDSTIILNKQNFLELNTTLNFTADKTQIGFGDTVHFYSGINGSPQSILWAFNPSNVSYVNGTSSTSANPLVLFHTSAKYDVRLIVNYSDSSLMHNKIQYVELAPLVNFTANTTLIKFGDSVQFYSTNNGKAIAYQWTFNPVTYSYLAGTGSSSANPLIKFLSAGQYNIQLKVIYQDTSIIINKNNYITLTSTIDFIADKTSPKSGDTVHFNSAFNGIARNYIWTFNPSTISYQQGTNFSSANPVLIFNYPGKFDVSLKVFYGDTFIIITKTQYINVLPNTGLKEIVITDLIIYPNPTYSEIIIESKESLIDAQCEVYDMQGRLIQNHRSATNDKWTILLPENPGVYFLKINTADDKQWVRKVVKE